jgi:hypothetical protein
VVLGVVVFSPELLFVPFDFTFFLGCLFPFRELLDAREALYFLLPELILF